VIIALIQALVVALFLAGAWLQWVQSPRPSLGDGACAPT